MLTLYIADAEKDVSMKNLSQKEAIALLRNLEDSLDSYCGLNEEGKTAFRMAIEALNCSEIPNNSDTISRQQAIDALRKMQTYKLFAGDDMLLIDQAEAQTELMMLPTVQPEQRWIPCSERLPNKFEDVWVTDNRGRTAVCHRGHSGWRDAESGDWMYYLDSIVAWMPYYVPEPYQGGE